jgi:hypothetical protein
MREVSDMSTAYFAKKGEFVSRSIVGEMVVVPVRGQTGDLESIYNLNEVGAFIWKLIDGRTSLRQIVDAVLAEFDVASEDAEKDTLQFIATLEEAGMIEFSGQGG